MARIQVFDGQKEIKVVSLETETILIGREEENDLVLADPSVSRRHAAIEPAGSFWLIRDHGSTNGTFVNDMLVRVQLLNHGDVVRIGRYLLRLDARLTRTRESTRVRVEELGLAGSPAKAHPERERPEQVAALAAFEKYHESVRRLWSAIGYVQDRERLLECVLEFLLSSMSADRASLLECSSATRTARWRSIAVRSRQGTQGDDEIRIDAGVLAGMAATADVVPVAGGSEDARPLALVAPIIERESVRGAIYIDRLHRDQPFSEEDRLFFGFVASQVAVGLTNATLFEEVLRQRSEIHAILASSVDGVLVTDEALRVTEANVAAVLLLGLEDQNPVGHYLFDLFERHKLRPRPEVLLPELNAGGATFQLDAPDDLLSGEVRARNLGGYLAPIRRESAGHRGYVATLRDASELRRVERLKSEFIHNVAHKLRTPLTVIRADIPLLRENLTGSALADELVEEIDRNAERLGRLVDQFVEFTDTEFDALRDGQAPIPVALSRVVAEAVRSVRPDADSREISIVQAVPSHLPRVAIRRSRFRLALERVLENAVKFSDPGAQVVVRAEAEHGVVRLHIADQGPGIPSTEVDAVFGVGYQIDSQETGQVPGAGLGLAIARHVIHEHGGEIRITSPYGEEPHGTTVSIVLPAAVGERGESIDDTCDEPSCEVQHVGD